MASPQLSPPQQLHPDTIQLTQQQWLLRQQVVLLLQVVRSLLQVQQQQAREWACSTQPMQQHMPRMSLPCQQQLPGRGRA